MHRRARVFGNDIHAPTQVAIGPIIDIVTSPAAQGPLLRNELGMQLPIPGFQGRVAAPSDNPTAGARVLQRGRRGVRTDECGTHGQDNSMGYADPPAVVQRPADYKSAIQQIENLRYERGPTTDWSDEYVSEFAKRITQGVRPGTPLASSLARSRRGRLPHLIHRPVLCRVSRSGFLSGQLLQIPPGLCRRGLDALKGAAGQALDDQRPCVKPPFFRRAKTAGKSTLPFPMFTSTSLGGRKSLMLIPTTKPSTVAASATGSSLPSE